MITHGLGVHTTAMSRREASLLSTSRSVSCYVFFFGCLSFLCFHFFSFFSCCYVFFFLFPFPFSLLCICSLMYNGPIVRKTANLTTIWSNYACRCKPDTDAQAAAHASLTAGQPGQRAGHMRGLSPFDSVPEAAGRERRPSARLCMQFVRAEAALHELQLMLCARPR